MPSRSRMTSLCSASLAEVQPEQNVMSLPYYSIQVDFSYTKTIQLVPPREVILVRELIHG